MTKEDFYVITTICIVCISFCALGFTIYQGRLTRSHNRKSLMPALCSILKTVRINEKCLEYALINKGHGTAKIKRFTFYSNMNEISFPELKSDISCFLKEYGSFPVSTGVMMKNSFFAKDEQFTVLSLEFPDEVKMEIFDKLIARYTIKVEYESFYGEADTYNSNKHLNR